MEVLHLKPIKSARQPPVVLLHGSWHGAWSWKVWSQLFVDAGYEVYAPDYPGHGKSSGNLKDLRLKDILSEVEEFMSGFERPSILVGHSLGGYVAQYLLAKKEYPAAILLSTVPSSGFPARTLAKFLFSHPLLTLRNSLGGDLFSYVSSPELVRQNFFCSSTPESIVQEASQQITGSPFRLLRELQFNSLGRPQGKTPILVMAGAQDYDYKPSQQSKVANKLGADFMLWQNSGHDIQLDNRAEDSAFAALTWLNNNLV